MTNILTGNEDDIVNSNTKFFCNDTIQQKLGIKIVCRKVEVFSLHYMYVVYNLLKNSNIHSDEPTVRHFGSRNMTQSFASDGYMAFQLSTEERLSVGGPH